MPFSLCYQNDLLLFILTLIAWLRWFCCVFFTVNMCHVFIFYFFTVYFFFFLPYLHTVIFERKPLCTAHAYRGRNYAQRPCRYSISMKYLEFFSTGVSLLLHLFNRLSSHLCTSVWTHEYYFLLQVII